MEVNYLLPFNFLFGPLKFHSAWNSLAHCSSLVQTSKHGWPQSGSWDFLVQTSLASSVFPLPFSAFPLLFSHCLSFFFFSLFSPVLSTSFLFSLSSSLLSFPLLSPPFPFSLILTALFPLLPSFLLALLSFLSFLSFASFILFISMFQFSYFLFQFYLVLSHVVFFSSPFLFCLFSSFVLLLISLLFFSLLWSSLVFSRLACFYFFLSHLSYFFSSRFSCLPFFSASLSFWHLDCLCSLLFLFFCAFLLLGHFSSLVFSLLFSSFLFPLPFLHYDLVSCFFLSCLVPALLSSVFLYPLQSSHSFSLLLTSLPPFLLFFSSFSSGLSSLLFFSFEPSSFSTVFLRVCAKESISL